MKEVGITVKLLETKKNDFKIACKANNTDMSKYLAKKADELIARHKKECDR